MHVTPAVRDVAEQSPPRDMRSVRYGRHHVPVRMFTPALHLDDGDVLTVNRDTSPSHSVNSSPIERGDVDSEVKRLAAAVADPGIPEHAAHRMLPVERLNPPRMSAPARRHGAKR